MVDEGPFVYTVPQRLREGEDAFVYTVPQRLREGEDAFVYTVPQRLREGEDPFVYIGIFDKNIQENNIRRKYHCTGRGTPRKAFCFINFPSVFVRTTPMLIHMIHPNAMCNFVIIEENREKMSKSKVL